MFANYADSVLFTPIFLSKPIKYVYCACGGGGRESTLMLNSELKNHTTKKQLKQEIVQTGSNEQVRTKTGNIVQNN